MIKKDTKSQVGIRSKDMKITNRWYKTKGGEN
jgi:hypothetical protein